MQQLGYKIDQPSNMVIVTANGTRVRALGMITTLPVSISHMLIKTPVHVLDSKDEVLILGNNWLRKVDAIVNWQQEKLTISHKGRTVNVPLVFTVTKALVNAEALKDDEEKLEYEYEEEELVEAPLYYSEASDDDSDEDLEYNP
jgi:hypothetical protein